MEECNEINIEPILGIVLHSHDMNSIEFANVKRLRGKSQNEILHQCKADPRWVNTNAKPISIDFPFTRIILF